MSSNLLTAYDNMLSSTDAQRAFFTGRSESFKFELASVDRQKTEADKLSSLRKVLFPWYDMSHEDVIFSWAFLVDEEEEAIRMADLTDQFRLIKAKGYSKEQPFPSGSLPSFRKANLGGNGSIILTFFDRVWGITACIRVKKYGITKIHGVMYSVEKGNHTQVISDCPDLREEVLEGNLRMTAKLRLAMAKNTRSIFNKRKIDLRKGVPDSVIDAMLGRNLSNAKTKELYLSIKKDRENGLF